MASDLAALITRLEKAKEGSWELDAEIAEHFGHKIEWKQANYVMTSYPVISWQAPDPYAGMREPCPQFTTNLSAAVALCERALPGWHWSIRKKSTNPDFFEGLVTQAAWSYAADRFKASHDCAPLALCIAILRAKASAHD